MKKIFISILGILLVMPSIYSQAVQTWTEDFDGTVTFTTISPTGLWGPDTLYYLPGSSTINPQSYLGMVPNRVGDSIILQTPFYDCTTYDYVILRFSHICKVSPEDITRIEYRTSLSNLWEVIPTDSYLGSAAKFSTRGFNAASYPEWRANDSTVFPSQSWWKEEIFDLAGVVNRFSVQFRFILKHGNTPGTQASYGWLIDNFELQAASHQLYLPIVKFIAPLIKDTVFSTGPWKINAKVKSQTNTSIISPNLIYTATYDGVSVNDTLPMTNVSGDSLWEVYIPQYRHGTEILYFIEGKDSAGNCEIDRSGYVIAIGREKKLILQDGSTDNGTYPFRHNYGYSRSMSLYTAAEIANRGVENINKIALRVHSAGSGSFPMKVWIKTVPASKKTWSKTADNYDWATATQNAMLVYDGLFHFSQTGWVDIPFTKTFSYNGIDNLVIMFEQNCGSTSCSTSTHMSTYSYYYYSKKATTTNMFWQRYADNNPPTSSGYFDVYSYRPDLRISIMGAYDSNSVAIQSINISDTVVIYPNSTIPVFATIKNKGNTDLTSAIISYSVNGKAPVSYNWTGNLLWDFEVQDSIGDYEARLNGYDTLKVWVSMPNKGIDSIVYDDTLTKIIYGRANILMEFVDTPADTVYNTGPFEVSARIHTFSGATVGTVSLFVASTHNGTSTNITLPMTFDARVNLWKTTIPHIQFGSDVTYSITLTDNLNNTIIIRKSYFVDKIDCINGVSKSILQGKSTNSDTYPFKHGYGYSRSMCLYPAEKTSKGGRIQKIALRVSTTGNGAFPMKIWLKTVPASKTTWDETTDDLDWSVLTQNATLVYDSVFHFNTLGWTDIPLTNLFFYNGVDNLVVMFEQNCGKSSCYSSAHMTTYSEYYYSTTAKNTFWQRYADNTPPVVGGNFTVKSTRPDLGITIDVVCPDSNSVELVAIESPEVITVGTVPIRVKLRNKGILDLKTCTINWSVNGGASMSRIWSGNLSEDFTDTTTIGDYISTVNQHDTFAVWVSMPNNALDSIMFDDTLMFVTLGCKGDLTGTKKVGIGGDFATLTAALNSIRDCKLIGDLTLQLHGIFTENIDLTNLAESMNGYSLTITSLYHNADSAIIRPSSDAGITLGKIRNLIIKDVTVDAATSGTYAIQFTDSCANILIRDCKLLAHPTTTLSSYCPVYRNSTDIVDSLFFIHNMLDGGYYGFYLSGGSSSALGTNVIFDSNTVSNNYHTGIHPDCIDFISCSYNTVLSRTDNTESTWYGLRMYKSNGSAIGNRIIQRSTDITAPYGIHAYYHNYYLNPNQSRALIANNEIILSTSSSTDVGYGIYAEYSKSDIINNSIYMTGSEDANGICINNTESNNIEIKNNSIVMTSPDAYPVYFKSTGNLNLYNMDYNNYYAPNNIGYYGNAITTMQAWQAQFPTDIHSVKVYPVYIDTTKNFLPLHSVGISCPLITGVTTDINGFTRRTTTTMGSYETYLSEQDLMLTRFSTWNNAIVKNQSSQIDINIVNLGMTSITDASFGWSLNGQVQSIVLWTANSPLPPLGQQTVSIGSFTAINADTFDVVVWIESVNGERDTVNWNDTVWASTHVILLSEFAPPFVEDTIYSLTFDVNAIIRTNTGAPLSPPKLTLISIIDGLYTLYDTLLMTLESNDIWTVSIPQQYYNSKIIYSLTVSDTMKTTSTITDSVFIKFTGFFIDSLIIGEGTITNTYTPMALYYNYSWSRQTYLYREICPEATPSGVYITKIAWQYVSSSSWNIPNQICYMRAVDDSIQNTGYIDPSSNGATQVWTGQTGATGPGWVEIVLTTPFFLPANKNLEIFWEHQNGTYVGLSYNWAHTATPYYMTVNFQDDDFFPSSYTGERSYNRPNIKITKRLTPNLYTGYNLSILEIVSPVNNSDELCTPNYVPVQVLIANLGTNDYDFSQYPVTFSAEVSNSGMTNTFSITKSTGILEAGKFDTVEIMSALSVMYTGVYDFKTWLTSSIDNVIYDDTLHDTYISNRISLPVNENFSSDDFVMPVQFLSAPVKDLGQEAWMPYTDTTLQILPFSGIGMLRYVGHYGAMALLTTRQLALNGVIDPELKFWYYHDATAHVLDKSYTDINIIVDDLPTTVMTLYRRADSTGWQQYTVDLRPYTNAQCVLIQFESMNRYNSQSAQYIDHITITSTPDLAISEIVISPEMDICNMTNKELKAILRTIVNQSIDLKGTSLTIQIGSQQPFTYPLTKLMPGISFDTVSVKTDVDLTDISSIKMYLTSPIDNNPLNDTATVVIDMHPQLAVTVKSLTGEKDCFKKGAQVQQEIVLSNIGNVNLSDIELELHITGDNSAQTVKESKTINLLAGDSIEYTFEEPYTAPADVKYQVLVKASLKCDPALINVSNVTYECIDMHNLSITGMNNPPKDKEDKVDSIESLTISVKNTDDLNQFEDVYVTAHIEDLNGQILNMLAGTISKVEHSSNRIFTFTEKYTVPNDSVYCIRVYLNNADNYPEDDTLFVTRRTNYNNVGIASLRTTNSFTLGQNIPNPATNSTRINYSIPEAGEVVFHVHSISGQLLYSKTINTEHGTNSIELNTNTFAAGVYFYSMEYKGQRLVKQLIINVTN
ncbi:MAG: T9SS type A sorting domain-containing protein [Bacteroidales bacterium]|jgi:hypothetical protein|nr:T9SS type A sorting domain-containing protein [Bacteroidales bacterium]